MPGHLRHSLGPVAWSPATPERRIYKSVKSKLLNALEERIETVDEIPSKSARMMGCNFIHRPRKYLETFGDLSLYVLRTIISNDSDHIFFITDQYWKDSIKSCERNRRANTGSIRLITARLEQKLPKRMKKYISVDANKEDLIDFLLNDWRTNKNYTGMLMNR